MADVTALSAGLAAALTSADFRATSYLADNFSPPCALVAAGKVSYHETFGHFGLGTYAFEVMLIVPRVSDRTAIQALEANMSTTGATSVIAALEADGTLGGIATGVIVRESGPMTNVTISPSGGTGVVYTMVPFTVEVYA